MPNFDHTSLGTLASTRAVTARTASTPTIAPSRAASYARVNTDRQTRFDARARRRGGDWDILEIPTALLWLDDVCAAAALNPDEALECDAAAMTDLWP